MDEAHQLTDAQQYDNFRTGLAKRKNSLLLTISTAGVSSTENPCLQLQRDAEQVLEGDIPNDRLFAAIYCCDADVDWTSREALLMASPNLGVSIDEEQLLLDQADAKRSPARQNAFRAMALNQWMSTSASWMNREAWRKCADPALKLSDFLGESCWIGLDTASKLDLASAVKLFRRVLDGQIHYYAFSRNYLPETQVNRPENQHYQTWVQERRLTSTDGASIEFERIESDLLDDIGKFRVEAVCFDPAHGALGLMQRVVKETGVTDVETPQRAVVISPAMRELEAAVADGRFHFDGDPLMTWCVGNIETTETRNSLYSMPEKPRPESKLDTAMALLFAMSRAVLVEPDAAPLSATDFFMFA
jgi:phage terminase large subunit-like protein